MKDFLSNIDVGVFDLDDMLEQGFLESLLPARARNQAKRFQNEADKLLKKQAKLLKLANEQADEELKQFYRDEAKRIGQKREGTIGEARKAQVERDVRGTTPFGALKNFGTTPAGYATVAGIGVMARSISKTFTGITEQVDQTGMLSSTLLEDFSGIADASKDALDNNKLLYNTVDNNFDTFIGLRREFGQIETYSIKTLDNITQLEDIIGLSADEATNLLSTFKGINRQSIQANTTLVKTFSLLANQEGVAFRDVMEDITDNADFFATYMSQSSEDIGKMIVQARRLGVSFSDITQVFDSFSDIESTLEKQARLSIFAGRRFDFLSVLEQLQSGNTMGAQQNIMGQIRGIDQGTLDNPFVKRQVAEGFGVDVPTLNKLYKASQNQLSKQQVIQQDFSEQLETFNDQFKQLGFSTIQKAITQYILNPLNQFLSTEKDRAQAFFDGLSNVIKMIGKVTTGLMKFIAGVQEGMQKILGSFGSITATLGMFGGAIAGLTAIKNKFSTSTLLQSQQVSLLTQIRNLLGAQAGTNRFSSTGGGMLAGKGGKLLAGVAGLSTLVGSTTMGARDETAGGVDAGGFLTATGMSALTGAGIGAMFGGIGAPIGGAIGAGLGALSYGLGDVSSDSDSVKANRGGIFKKRYRGKMDVAEAGKPEGFVPLETMDGKPTMPADLSDRTIKKLAGAMSKMRFTGQVNVDGKKQTIEFYNHAMNPSSALNV